MDAQKRRRTYSSYPGSDQKRRKQFTLETGMTGFLCTCNFREKDCIRDAYKILTEFVDNARETNNDEAEDSVDVKNHDSDEDISDALNKEIKELKGESEKPASLRLFQVVDIGVKNVIFIKSTVPNPLELVTKIVKELDSTKKQRTRFLLRLIPIEVVCKANMNDIRLKANDFLEKHFSQEPKSFSIIFNRRSNNNIKREEVIQDIAEIISKKNPGNKANLKNPEIAVIIEVIRGFCLMGVAPDYFKYKKYNLLEICNVKENIDSDKNDSTEEIKKSSELTEEDRDYKSDTNDGNTDIPTELKKEDESSENTVSVEES